MPHQANDVLQTVTVTRATREVCNFEWKIEDSALYCLEASDGSNPNSLLEYKGVRVKGDRLPWKIKIQKHMERTNYEDIVYLRLYFLKCQSADGCPQFQVAESNEPEDDCSKLYFQLKLGGSQNQPFYVKRGCAINGWSNLLAECRWSLLEENYEKLLPASNKLCIWLKLFRDINNTNNDVQVIEKIQNVGQSLETANQREVHLTSFSQLLTTQLLSDVTIVCGDTKKIGAHKAILAARSPVFSRMFQSNMKETTSNMVMVPDVDAPTMELALQFIYTGQVEMHPESLANLLGCAEKYDLVGLKSMCLKAIYGCINDQNAGQIAVAVHLYNADMEVKQQVFHYCQSRHSILNKDPEYRRLFLENPAAFLGE